MGGGGEREIMINRREERGLPQHLSLRSFRSAEDDKACSALELRASQHKNAKIRRIPLVGYLYGLFEDSIQVYPAYTKGFDAQAAAGADENEIVVCCDKSDNDEETVVAVIVCNIRTVFWGRKPIKVGWVYGLRVHEDYQCQGIGTALSDELERRCRKRGVAMLYLTVNQDNEKAKSLYSKLGYQAASERSVRTKFLMAKESISDEVLVVSTVVPEIAAEMTATCYDSIDLSPAGPSIKDGFMRIASSPYFERIFIAVNRSELSSEILQLEQAGDEKVLSNAIAKEIQNGKIKSYGGVSLWNGSAFRKFVVVRLIFRKETWLSAKFRWSLALGLTTISGVWWQSLARRFLLHFSNTTQSSWWPAVVLGAEVLAAAATSVVMYKFYRFYRFIISRDSSHLSARAFAPLCSGPMGIDCLHGALVGSRNFSQRNGHGIWIMNVAEAHPDSSAFGKSGFSASFLQKWLSPGSAVDSPSPLSNEKWKSFSPSAFFDPRDL